MVARKKAVAKKKTTTKKAVAKKPAARGQGDQGTLHPLRHLAHLADNTGLTKKQVTTVLEELKNVIEGHVKNGGARVFTLPGLLKIKVTRKPATKARKGINPFNGQEITFKAKPARNVVKIQALRRYDAAA